MKNIILLMFVCIIHIGHTQCIVNVDSLIRIAAQTINQQEQKMPTSVRQNLTERDYKQAYYVNDILDNQPITQRSGYGIYVFGRIGDDFVSAGIFLYDLTGCQILPRIFNYESLGMLLDFFERNHFSEKEMMKYLKLIYEFEKEENNIGFRLEN